MISQTLKDVYYTLALPVSHVLRPLYAMHYRLRRQSLRRVHVGCGGNYMDGFVNIDGNYQRRVDYVLDVRAGMPFGTGTIDFIYSCHMLEHVYLYDAMKILREWLRVLSPNGYVRLVLPDFHYALRIASGEIECVFPREFTDSHAQAINFLFCDGQHKFGYTQALIKEIATAVGFGHVEEASLDGDENVTKRELPTGSFCVNLYKTRPSASSSLQGQRAL
jgi:predicted SAM-dependent methyltransferase